jgi:transposase InsO family protein
LPSQRVIRELETLAECRGRPDTIRSDNNPKFTSEALSQWCKKVGLNGSLYNLANLPRIA